MKFRRIRPGLYESPCWRYRITKVADVERARNGGMRKTFLWKLRVDGNEILCHETLKDAKEHAEVIAQREAATKRGLE